MADEVEISSQNGLRFKLRESQELGVSPLTSLIEIVTSINISTINVFLIHRKYSWPYLHPMKRDLNSAEVTLGT